MDLDVLNFIKRCMKQNRILWTYHVNMRMYGRYILRESILEAVDTFEIIEKYPDDKYLPSYLIYASYGKEMFHIHAAVDKEGDNIRIITAYKPSPDKWSEDFKTRRRP